MKLTKKLETEILKLYNACWDAYLKGDLKTHASFLSADFKMIGSSDGETFNNKQEWIAYCRKTKKQFAGVIRLKNRKIQTLPAGEEVMVVENSHLYALIEGKWTYYSKFRVTGLLKNEKNGWKIIHWHSSLPDSKANEGEVIAAEKIKKENLELRDAVARRTVELQQKNRELEIEASLERVRSAAMAMNSAGDMLTVCKIISQQLQALEVKGIRNVQTAVFDQHKGTYLNYEYYAKHDKLLTTEVNYRLHKEHAAFAKKMLRGNGSFYTNSFKGKKLKDWYAYQQTTNQFVDRFLKTAPSLNYYMLSLGEVMLGLSTYNPLSVEETDLFKRFVKVFELAYRRYLDIAKAEKQAREAQVEGALERVRTRTMGMRRSEEIADIVGKIFTELRLLDLVLNRVLIWIFNDAEKYVSWWSANPEIQSNAASYRIDYTGQQVFQCYLQAWQHRTPLYFYTLSGAVKKAWEDHLFTNTELANIPEAVKTGMREEGTIFTTSTISDYGLMMVGSFAPLSNESIDIIQRFGRVFQQSYTRYLDVQKAEAQARQAQIELSLERVRARAMAMRNSDELKELIGTVFTELTKLDLVLTRCIIWVFDPLTDGARWWMANSEEPANPISFFVRQHDHPAYLSFVNAWKNHSVRFVYDLNGEDKVTWDKILFHETELANLPEVVKKGMQAPERVLLSGSFNNFGGINTASLQPLSEEHFTILLRFASVFDLTYTRFLDLQKAEAQAREAKIEAALEKVRSRSLAMHKSDELQEVVATVFERLKDLEIEMDTSSILVPTDNENEIQYWFTNAEGYLTGFRLPLFDNVIAADIFRVRRTATDLHVACYNFEEKNQLWHHLFEYTDFKRLPESRKKFIVGAECFNIAIAVSKNTGVQLNRYHPKAYTEKELEILKRFARVFEQAYTRFLDLQKAEAQAREAQVEAALEKVRSRSLAMHKSDELQKVVNIVFEKLLDLDIKMNSTNLAIFNDSNRSIEYWIASPTQARASCFQIPYLDLTITKDLFKARANGDAYFNRTYTRKEKNEWFEQAFAVSDLGLLPENRKRFILEADAYSVFLSFSKYTGIQLNRYSANKVNEAEASVLNRFAKVFEQAYIRFLDLQKAEAQAREARIETALEKVRSKAMAMHQSDDLRNVVATVFEELEKLNPDLVRCGIAILDKEKPRGDIWITLKTTGNDTIGVSGDEPLDVHPLLKHAYEAWLRHEDYAHVLKGDELRNYYDSISTTSFQSAITDQFQHEAQREQHYFNAVFQYGSIFAFTDSPFPDESRVLLKRFANVFDHTYKRFLDLQRAEEQAREAKIEASLERVRARAMAMQRSDELKQLIGTVSKELGKLDIVLDRCFIVTYDPVSLGCTWWMANPEFPDEPTGLFVPFHEHPPYLAYLKGWQERMLKWQYILEGEIKKQWDKFLFVETELSQLPAEVIANMRGKEKVYLSSSFNNFGYLSLATLEPLTEAQFDIMLRFAKVFDLTYTRFNDLKQAEEQAKEAQVEAALERVRSRSMAMHRSDEVMDVAVTLYDELQKLKFEFGAATIVIMDKETGNMQHWVAGFSQKVYPTSYQLNYFDHPCHNAQLNAWKSGDRYLVYHLQGEERLSYVDHLFSQTDYRHFPETEKEWMRAADPAFTLAFMKHGALMWAPREATPDQLDILQRFAKVFEQSYTRFLDLQKAEAQARESQVQLALERVRARTMAMHRSEELAETSQVLFRQLNELGGIPDRISIAIVDETNHVATFWSTDQEGGQIAKNFVARLNEPTVISKTYQHWKKNKSSLIIDLQGDELRRWMNFVRDELGIFVNDEQIRDRRVHTACFFSHGWILVTTHEALSTETVQITERFASVFNLTYRRFQDLQKAEAQAREGQIEASLERVRSKTMAMHNSQDVGETVVVMFSELKQLGIYFNRCGILIFSDENKPEVWTARANEDGKAILTIGQLDLDTHDLQRSVHGAWKEKKSFYQYDLAGDNLVEYYEAINRAQFYQSRFDMSALPEKEFHSDFFFAEGAVFAFTAEPIPEEHKKIIQRFAGVFGQTYRRYLDLQNAEAQAKESQIQLALERVRARTMAMQQSSELLDASNVLFQQFSQLDEKAEQISIGIIDSEETEMELFATTHGRQWKEGARIPFKSLPIYEKIYNAWKEGKKSAVFEITGDELQELNQFKLAHPHYQVWSADELPQQRWVIHNAFFSRGILTYANIERRPAETTRLLERFASVFDLTYTRFLDLQKAEAQAKEARIEASLERVRARTMAMHNSQDVSIATATMLNELEKLDIQNFRGGILNIRDDQTMEVWSINTLDDGTVVRAIGDFDMRMHPFWQSLYTGWKNKDDYSYFDMSGQDKENYIRILDARRDYLPGGLQHLPDCHVQSYFFGEGAVWTFSLQPHTEENKQVMKRFASVFSLTFRRYQDLKKAEAQAREATIEASLERVRGKAMAMHTSKDLASTIHVFYHELNSLHLTPRRCGVGLIDKETHTAELSTMNSTDGGQSVEVIGVISLRHHPVLEGIYSNWLTKTEYHPVLRGNEITEYYKLVRPQVAFPDYPNDSVQFGYFFFFEEGGVYAWTENELQEDELKIYRRFTSVISLTYKRYKDLRDAELRAKNAIRDAALDRIRADIASMRSVGDLDRITPLIWNELNTLKIPFIRCGVFIMDETQQLIHTFLSTPDGKAIAAFHLPYDTPGNLSRVLEHWREKRKYIDHWDESAFTELAGILVKQGAIATPDQYLQSIPQGGFCLHFLPFLQGMLYVGSISQLSDGEIELIQSVADAFATAYARYEDFNKLEAAKQQVERTLNDLKQAQQQLIQSEKMASLGELTAGIAHEIQNPLNFVNNFSDVSGELLEEMKSELQKGNAGEAIQLVEDVRENLQKILHHGKRADAIVKGMLQHSRTSSGQKEATDLNGLVDEYLRLAYHGLRAKDKSFNAKFTTDFDPGIGRIEVIPQDIGRVILNLINNAFYAVSQKKKQGTNGYEPTVHITTKKQTGKIELRIRDNGDGIDPKILDKIFQPFFTTKPAGQGTGLGLSLSYDIVTRSHAGELKVQTKDGEGTEFIVELPV